jgi:hypothetical protein
MSISTACVENQLHVVMVDGGRILHRLRKRNGTWNPWSSIAPPEGHTFLEASCACLGDALHVVIKDTNGFYWHDIRQTDGSWQGAIPLPDQPLLHR